MLSPALEIEKSVEISAAHPGAPGAELRHIDYLDGWRGLAIVLVLQAHMGGLAAINTGRLGVDVFFVLSGFLMARILFVKRVPLGTFYKRRISRILPVFLVFITVVYGAGCLLHRQEAQNFLYTLTFTRTYLPANASLWRADIPVLHLWSLHVEEHCYVFLGLLTLIGFLRGREGLVLVLAGTASVAIYFIDTAFPSIAPPDPVARTEVAASHLLISAGYCLMRKRYASLVRPWMPLAAATAAVSCYASFAPWWCRILFSPYLLAFTVNHLSETPRWCQAGLALPPLRLLGIWSYSIYLWQQPILGHYFFGNDAHVISCAAAIAAGAASFYLFENPVRTWLNKRW
jgi:peptidoglycan/LPS O-acetylase OafA/YrhL